MNIIAVNGQEISLGCFVNLHTKTTCVPNGIFAKINKYYVTITHGLLQLMHSNDLHLLVTIIHHLMICYQLIYKIELYYNFNISYLENLLTDCHEIYTPY